MRGRVASSGMMFLPSFMNIHQLVPVLLRRCRGGGGIGFHKPIFISFRRLTL